MVGKRWIVASSMGLSLLSASLLRAQGAPNVPLPAATQTAPSPFQGAPISLTLKRAIELALQNSKDIQVARLQSRVAGDVANVTRAEFRPNVYIGSGAGYTYGIPATPGGQAPSVFNATYNQQLFNEPLRGLEHEQEEQARAQRFALEQTRELVLMRTASAYLELVKVRSSLEVLRKEKDSAEKILEVTKQREGEGFELPMEVTRSQLMRAQVVQRVLQLEGRQDELEVFLRNEMGLPADQPLELTAEELPGSAEQEGANLVALASQNSTSILLAQSDVKAKELRLQGEKRGNLPTVQLVALYSVLAKFNNYEQYLANPNNFRYNNLNAGVNIQLPIYSAKTRANIELAKANLDAANLNLVIKRNQVSIDVRQRSRKLQQSEAAKEVARLELQLAQQNVSVLQSQFGEGRMNLRDVEKARLDENEKWMNYLDSNFQRQQAQLDLLHTAGQLDKVLQ
jgi:adhesin transport system outer membrane protein